MNDDDQGDLFSYRPGRLTTRADQIYAKFVIFHLTNPKIWELFVKYTFDRIDRGFKNYGAGAIFERIRWDTDTPTASEDNLKLCNDYRAYYARMFHAKYPQYDGFFRIRKRRSEDKPAFPHEPIINTDPPINEARLFEQLKDLLDRTPG